MVLTKGGLCQEKVRLMDEFLASAKELVRAHNEQAQALIDGDPEFSRFDVVIHSATERKRRAKYDYLSHLEQHGC
jgi:hypothetical protein